jgi:ferric-dicitrate binding protein FerR (iron transport regulator)
MKEDIPWKILEEKFKEEISDDDNKLLSGWIVQHPANLIIYNQLQNYFNQHKSLPVDFTPDASKAFDKFRDNIYRENRKAVPRKLLMNVAKVAAVVLISFMSYWLWHRSAKDAGITYTTIAASDTALLKHQMPDGSIIWLKAKSKIRFAENFKKNRTVSLVGEAYFEVSHDKKHPFRVFADQTITTVVGTKFNIRSWLSAKETKLTVNEGKVLFGKEHGTILPVVKGQEGTVNKNDGTVKVQTFEANYLSWLTREFYFENAPLNRIMQKLADVYGFRFIIANQNLKDSRLTARFSKRPLSEILKTLETATGAQFLKNDDAYIIQ